MRQFIRHPTRIPVEIRVEGAAAYDTRQSRNLSLGGLALQSGYAFVPGSIVVVRIPLVRPVFETRARVAWCVACKEDFELGIEFLNDDDAFRARMVEQVCYIENYKLISKYASEFPDVGKPQLH